MIQWFKQVAQWFKRLSQKVGRWILFRKDDEDSDMAIGRSSMTQQIARPPGKVVPNELRQAPAQKPVQPKKKTKQAVAIALSDARRAKKKRK
jgi:hypothetical protein